MKKVPKLRFKEFVDEWEEKKLVEISNIFSGLTPLRSNEKYYINATIPWIKTTDLNNSYIKKTEEKLNKIVFKETSIKLLPKNTLLIAMYGGFNQIGRTGLTTLESTTNQALSAIIFKDKNLNSYFFLNFFNYKVNYWKKVSASSRKDPNITKKDIENFKVIYPKVEEQKKIADFLSSVDVKINLTENKLELLKEYKKGIMQKIFSQKLRFKDKEGKNYPNWKCKKVGELLIESKDLPQKQNLEKRITVKLNLKGIEKRKVTSEEKEGATTNYLRKEGQFIYGKQNFHKGAFGIIPKELDGYQSSSDIPSFNFVEDSTIGKYFYYYFSQKNVYENLENIATGTGSKRIQPKVFFNVKLDMPCLEEQQKIADFLSSIDTKIEKISDELENLKEFKKGLLQQMFI